MKFSDVATVLVTIALLALTTWLYVHTRPMCGPGRVAVYVQYTGWVCLSGGSP